MYIIRRGLVGESKQGITLSWQINHCANNRRHELNGTLIQLTQQDTVPTAPAYLLHSRYFERVNYDSKWTVWNIYKIQLLQHGQNTSVRHNSESNKRIMVTLLKSQIQNTKAILLHVQLCKSALLLPAVKERKFSQSVAMCACLHPVY